MNITRTGSGKPMESAGCAAPSRLPHVALRGHRPRLARSSRNPARYCGFRIASGLSLTPVEGVDPSPKEVLARRPIAGITRGQNKVLTPRGPGAEPREGSARALGRDERRDTARCECDAARFM